MGAPHAGRCRRRRCACDTDDRQSSSEESTRNRSGSSLALVGFDRAFQQLHVLQVRVDCEALEALSEIREDDGHERVSCDWRFLVLLEEVVERFP